MTSRPRSVLLLAYFFPPLGGAGVQRTLKHVKYLPEHGWHATVITTSADAYPATDRSLLDEVPATTRVVRTFEPRAWRHLRIAVMYGFSRLRLRSLQALAGWPDDTLAWAPGAVWAAVREVRKRRPDVIYSTSSPYTAHLAAMVVHRLTGVPWVADFRDEWASNPHMRDQPRVVRWLSERAERAIARAASRTTVVADYFRIAGTATRPPAVIGNGIDEHDVAEAAAEAPPRGPRLRLSYVGTMYDDQDCEPVFAALRRLIADGRLAAGALELRAVGNVWLLDLESRVPVELSVVGYVDHDRALLEMRSADALLFYVAPSSRAPSGKLYEYLASGRPILCIAREDNLAHQLVEGWDAGICATPDDDVSIEAAILELVDRWERGALHVSPEVRTRTLERFSRRKLAGRLADVLEEAARTRASGPGLAHRHEEMGVQER